MTRRNPLSLLVAAAALALVAIAVAGCGGGDDQATAATSGSNASGGSSTVGVTDVSGLGKILVDSQGRTAYLFEKDTGSKSTCSGACAQEWPPVATSGTKQVTYNGHPLYLFAGDHNPGDTAGQNLDTFGAEWYVLSPAGDKVEGKAKDSGGGYAY
jgi:predicted lipoprotein with Yx(FWY)xxD motif